MTRDTGTTVAIRPAREEDMPDMLAVLEHANMHHVPSPEMPELDWRDCFVAEEGGRIAGMCGFRILSGTEAKTTLMAVAPAYRGKKVGFALQARRMDELAGRGVETLTTNADRPETIAWYKKHFGYQEIGTLAKEHEFGHPDIDHWTTLRTDLNAWKRRHEQES
jgi:ribosomal-protein-alanine N-acetyltransferase